MSRLRVLIGAFLLPVAVLLGAAPVAAQALTPAETARVDALVAKSLALTGTPAAEVAIVRGGRLVFTKLYGRPSPTLASGPATLPFPIGSISKQFLAAGLLMLQAEGKLSLDDPVAKYLSGISGGDRITIRQLLQHTSGLRDYWPQDYKFPTMDSPATPRHILDVWARAPLDFSPGTQWQYSNTGYVAAGLILEKVAGMPVLDFVQARILRPLGIVAYDQDHAIGGRFPEGHGRNALGPLRVVRQPAPGWLFAAGELSMSASDLAKWDIARMDRALLTPAEWREQETSGRLADGVETGYGLGVDVGASAGRRTISHGGEAVGFLASNDVFPDQRAAVAVLTNSWSGAAVRDISRGIIAAVVPSAADAPDTGSDEAALARTRALYAALQAGAPDRATFTDNLAAYFTPEVIADFRDSLRPLGPPSAIAQDGPASLRGGFVVRRYRVTYPGRTLSIGMFLEPGPNGRFEQFLVAPRQ